MSNKVISKTDYWSETRKLYNESCKILRELESLRSYQKLKVCRFSSVKTEDKGTISNQEYFRIKTWSNNNQAFWFFSDEYANYVSLPNIKGVTWVEDKDYDQIKRAIYSRLEANNLKREELNKKYQNGSS